MESLFGLDAEWACRVVPLYKNPLYAFIGYFYDGCQLSPSKLVLAAIALATISAIIFIIIKVTLPLFHK